MQRWEYSKIYGDPYCDELIKELNKLGKERWEVCGTFSNGTNSVVLLKREC